MKHEWMRQDKVDILKYLPAFLAKDPRFKATNDADSLEHDAIRIDLQDVIDQLYVESATWGIEKWEELVGIDADDSSSIESRREAVLAKLRKPESVTEIFLTNLINRFISDESGKVTADTSDYSVEIRFNAVSHEALSKIIHGVKTYIPAHLGLKGKIDYKHERTLYVGMKRKTSRVINVYPMDSQKEVFDKPLYLGIAMEVVEDLEIR